MSLLSGLIAESSSRVLFVGTVDYGYELDEDGGIVGLAGAVVAVRLEAAAIHVLVSREVDG